MLVLLLLAVVAISLGDQIYLLSTPLSWPVPFLYVLDSNSGQVTQLYVLKLSTLIMAMTFNSSTNTVALMSLRNVEQVNIGTGKVTSYPLLPGPTYGMAQSTGELFVLVRTEHDSSELVSLPSFQSHPIPIAFDPTWGSAVAASTKSVYLVGSATLTSAWSPTSHTPVHATVFTFSLSTLSLSNTVNLSCEGSFNSLVWNSQQSSLIGILWSTSTTGQSPSPHLATVDPQSGCCTLLLALPLAVVGSDCAAFSNSLQEFYYLAYQQLHTISLPSLTQTSIPLSANITAGYLTCVSQL